MAAGRRMSRMILKSGLPQDALTGGARVTMIAQGSVLIEGQRGVVELSPGRIRLRTAGGVIAVEFCMGDAGLGSSTVYWGVNYVPSNSSFVGFQGQQWDYWKAQGEGRLYYDPEGDNTCYVRKLAECWYYYEMKF